MVVTGTATESGDLIAARLRALLAGGWDARLLCCGERWERDRGLRDHRISSRVEFKSDRDHLPVPRQLRRRPVKLLRYLGATNTVGPFDERLLELRPGLVHFHSGTDAHRGLWLRRLLDCRIVVSFREDGGDLELFDQEALWGQADLLLFADAAMLERAVVRGCPRDRAEVLAPPLPDGAPTATRGDSAGGTLRILSAGPLIWEQGFEHSVHAVRLLLDEGVDCEYRILGNGADLDPVAFARHQLGLSDHVEIALLGGNSLVEELRAADVFLDPAVTDTTSPTPLLMAQSLGIPVVATHREGLSEDAGIAVPRRSARAIAEALARLASDAALRRRMGEAGRREADRNPTLEQHLHRLQDLYRRVLA
jgi:glycosyltransferase involved in cell wall biosynthesis